MQNSKFKTNRYSLITIHSRRRRAGFTLIELLVVLGVFSILALFTTQSLSSILQTRTKTEVSRTVRQEAEYALSSIERNLRGALSATCDSATQISYVDPGGAAGSFSCQGTAPDSYIASGSARLTSTAVAVKAGTCAFTCTPLSDPNQVNISFTIEQSQITSDPKEQSNLSVSSQIILRNQ